MRPKSPAAPQSHFVARTVPTFITQALSGSPLTVAGDGSQTRSLCYVDDLVDELVRMLHSGPRRAPIAFIPRPVDDPTVRRPDITPARVALRWEPRVDFEKGLLSTIAWFQHESVPVPASS